MLSIFLSFLLKRIFHGKVYVPFTTTCLLLISFFSAGVPEYWSIPENLPQPSTQGLHLNNLLPLSFPFYASIYHRRPMDFRDVEWEDYRLNFITLILQETRVVFVSILGTVVLSLSWTTYILYFSFFSLVNIIGAAIGYWLSQTAFIDKLLKKRK